MPPEAVIDRQVSRQPTVAFLRVLEGHRVGPLPADDLDKALGLAVGAGRVWPGADVLEAMGAAGFGKCFGDVGRAVVAHHLSAQHALAVEPGQSPAQEADGRALLLVSEYLDVGQPCGVVDRSVDPVIADARGASLLLIAGDAMSDPAEADQPLVGTPQRNPCFCGQFCQGVMVVEVLRKQSQPALLRQTGIGVCMYGT